MMFLSLLLISNKGRNDPFVSSLLTVHDEKFQLFIAIVEFRSEEICQPISPIPLLFAKKVRYQHLDSLH